MLLALILFGSRSGSTSVRASDSPSILTQIRILLFPVTLLLGGVVVFAFGPQQSLTFLGMTVLLVASAAGIALLIERLF